MHSWSNSSSSACSKKAERAATDGPAMQANISLPSRGKGLHSPRLIHLPNPSAWIHIDRAARLPKRSDLVVCNGVKMLSEVPSKEIFSFIDCPIVLYEFFFSNHFLDLRIVLISIKHDEGVEQYEH